MKAAVNYIGSFYIIKLTNRFERQVGVTTHIRARLECIRSPADLWLALRNR
jgi:hypothetical protein